MPIKNKDERSRSQAAYYNTSRGRARIYITGNKNRRCPCTNSFEEVVKYFENKPTSCECCGQIPPGKALLLLDHDHNTGKIRGWVCTMCNNSLHDIKHLRQVEAYLNRHEVKKILAA